MSTVDFSQFRTLVTLVHGSMKQNSATVANQMPTLRKKLDTFKTQNRNQYFQFLNRLLQEDVSFDDAFKELKILLEIQDPVAIKLYSHVKNHFFTSALKEEITFDPTQYFWPKIFLDHLGKCLQYELTVQNYGMLDQVVTFLNGNDAVEQYTALYVLRGCFIGSSLLVNDQKWNPIFHRAFILTHPEYHMRVRYQAIEFIEHITHLNLPYLENSLTVDEIRTLFEHHLEFVPYGGNVLISITNLAELFYDNVPGFMRRCLQVILEYKEKLSAGFGEQNEIFFRLIDLETKRKAAIEEYEEYDIPHFTQYHNDFSECFDVCTENMNNVYEHYKGFNDFNGVVSVPTLDKFTEMAGLLELPPTLTNLPYELQIQVCAGIKRDYTAMYNSIVKVMDHHVNTATIDFPSKHIFDRFQVPPVIIDKHFKEMMNSSWPRTNRAVMYCPTSVAMNASVRKDTEELMVKRLNEPIVHPSPSGLPYLQPGLELIEIFKIHGISSHISADAVLQHFLPILDVTTSGTNVDNILHKNFFILLQLSHGSISEETAKQTLQMCLNPKFSGDRHLSVMSPFQHSIIVTAIKNLSSEDANKLLKKIEKGFDPTFERFLGWNIEGSYELLRLIGQRSQFTTTELKTTLQPMRGISEWIFCRPCYNVFSTFSGFESAIGSPDYLDFVVNFVQRQLRPNDDLQLEFVLKGLNSLFDVHKKKSCVELFASKMEELLNLIDSALVEPSNETLLAFLVFIRNVLRTCPEQVTSVLQHHSTVLRATELELSSAVSNLTMKSYANQISSSLKLQVE